MKRFYIALLALLLSFVAAVPAMAAVAAPETRHVSNDRFTQQLIIGGKSLYKSGFLGPNLILRPSTTDATTTDTTIQWTTPSAARTYTIPDAGANGSFIFSNDGGQAFTFGGGSGTVKPQGILNMQVTQVSTAANTTETDGHTYTLPANSLNSNGDAVRVRVWGTTAATATNKTLKIYLGGVAVFTTGAVASNAKEFYAEMLIVRTGVGTQTCLVSGHFAGALLTTPPLRFATTSDETTALVIKDTMTNGTANATDMTVTGFEVTALPQ